MPTSQTQSAWPLQKPQQLVYIELGADNGGMMLGICEHGFSFRAVSPLKTDGPVHFTFALDGKTRLQGTGEVAWSEEGGKTGGLKFTATSSQFRESLREWLASESSPKSVGREVTPAVALPPEEAKPTAPPHAWEAKPAMPKPVVPAAAKPIVPVPAEPKPAEAKPVGHIQPEQLIDEVELPSPKPILPWRVEQKPAEAKPAEPAQPQQFVREVETQITEHVPESVALRPETKPVEAKPEPPKQVEPPRVEPIIPEPELRTVAPLAQAETPSEPVFSLPNFRLPSVDVPHLPMQEIVEAAEKYLPTEAPPAEPPVEISPAMLSHSLPEIESRATETSVLPRERGAHEIFSEDFPVESPRLNRAAAAGIITLALAIVLAALVLSFRREAGEVLIRLGQQLTGEERKPAATQQPVSVAAPVQNPAQNAQRDAAQPAKTGNQSSAQSTDKSSSAQPSANSPTETPNASAANTLPSSSGAPNSVQRIQDLPPAPDGGTGEKEFQQARNILKGNHRQRDLSLAVRLLWTSVRKGNVPAEVTLADLYARGDGVARSCAQARVLLEAAVQKGSSEGRRRLGLLKQQGCS